MTNENKNLKEKITKLEDELQIKNAELLRYRQELVKVNQTLERVMAQISHELQTAQVIQKYLSPTEIPNILGFEFSTKFVPGSKYGGDYFDIFEHEDKMKFGILISSASGYSISSLLLSVIIKMSSQIEARRGLPPHQVVQSLVAEMVPQITTKDHASIFYGVIDRRTYEMTYCSIGNIAGIVQHYGKEVVKELAPMAPPIEKGFNVELKDGIIALQPRDRIALVTHGVLSAENRNLEKWGANSLIESIKKAPKTGVHELRNEIIYNNEKFTGKQTPLRDQTIVVLEVKDRVIKLAKS